MTDYSVISPRVNRVAEMVVGRDMALSYPVPALINGIRADRFFVYGTGFSKTRPRPFAALTVAMDGGVVLEYADCHVRDFMDTEKYPLDGKISYALPQKVSVKELKLEQSTINKLYELVRRVAFKDELTEQERKTVAAWYVMLENSVPRDLVPFYEAMGKEFYEWVVKYV